MSLRAVVGPALACVAMVVLLAACGSPNKPSKQSSAPTSARTTVTTVPPTTTTTTTVPPATTTTSVPVPPDPLSTPDAASGALITAWEGGDRTAAARVATAAAIDTLFATPYSGEVLNDRGCGTPGPNPVQCSWGPYADASPTNPLYDLTVQPTGSSWYVGSVVKLT